MNDFFASYAPSLLLFSAENAWRVVLVAFAIFFGVIVVVMVRRDKGAQIRFALWKKKTAVIAKKSVYFALFGIVAIGATWAFEHYRGKPSFTRTPDESGFVTLSEAPDATDATAQSDSGAVLAEQDAGAVQTGMPKSEHFRVGYLGVGGDNQVFSENAENKKLSIYGIGYKTVVEENRENTGAIIRWQTNKPSRAEVLYRKSTDTEFRRVSEEMFDRDHTVVLEKLGYGATYVFSIAAKDKWGNVIESEKYALYSGSDSPSLFDLLENAFGDMFGWAMRK